MSTLISVGILTIVSVGLALPTTQPAEAVGSATTWLGYLNEYRTESGLNPVTHNTGWDQGTYSHSCYMNQNGVTHEEVPGKPGYTSAGALAGTKSNVAGGYYPSGNKTTDAKDLIDIWMGAPFHAIGMLRPHWKSTSLGVCYTSGSSPRYAGTLDILRGLSTATTQSVVFPGNGATTHLTSFLGESPDPTDDCKQSPARWGLPLIAMFPKAATNATATVSGPSGTWNSSQLCVLDPQDITDSTGKRIAELANAVIVIPPARLTEGSYRVNVSAGGQSKSWSFSVKTSDTPPTTSSTTSTTTKPPTTSSSTTRPPTTSSTTTRPPTTSSTTSTTRPPNSTTSTTRAPYTTTTVARPTTTIAQQAPLAIFRPGDVQHIKVGESLTFDGTQSRDPDGGRVTFEWRTTGLSGVASRNNLYSRTFRNTGRFGVELTVTDDEGLITKKHIDVWVHVPAPPEVTFAPGVDQYVKVGDTMSFTGWGSNDPDGGTLTYEWRTTGVNGVASNAVRYGRRFTQPGRVGVELTVIDDEGEIAKKHINVWVSAPPVAIFSPGSDQNVMIGQTLTFDGSQSNDPDGGALKYEWRTTGANRIVSTTNGYSRKFTQEGRYGVELTVIDDEGEVTKKHINVWVAKSEPPVAVFSPGSDQNVRVGQTLSFDGSQSRDPDGGALKYEWRTTGANRIVSTTNGYSRKFTQAGRFGVELTVIDDEGEVTKKHINVWVS